jgi:hypothetical protein
MQSPSAATAGAQADDGFISFWIGAWDAAGADAATAAASAASGALVCVTRARGAAAEPALAVAGAEARTAGAGVTDAVAGAWISVDAEPARVWVTETAGLDAGKGDVCATEVLAFFGALSARAFGSAALLAAGGGAAGGTEVACVVGPFSIFGAIGAGFGVGVLPTSGLGAGAAVTAGAGAAATLGGINPDTVGQPET